MDTDKAADRLRSLASDGAKRSKTAQLRDVFREIEAALEAGVSQATILEELRVMGLDVNPNTFRSTLRRLRTRRPEANAHAPLQRAPMRSGFAETGDGFGPSTTVRGSLYDVEALSRLLLASAYARPAEDVLGAWRAAPRT